MAWQNRHAILFPLAGRLPQHGAAQRHRQTGRPRRGYMCIRSSAANASTIAKTASGSCFALCRLAYANTGAMRAETPPAGSSAHSCGGTSHVCGTSHVFTSIVHSAGGVAISVGTIHDVSIIVAISAPLYGLFYYNLPRAGAPLLRTGRVAMHEKRKRCYEDRVTARHPAGYTQVRCVCQGMYSEGIYFTSEACGARQILLAHTRLKAGADNASNHILPIRGPLSSTANRP